ncbi:hypothetical protein VB620_06835 [Nodularia harveyana UHCC-0300]|uniref:Uncharacterized protein n=1 Tax=Nodularia harveyana UHCC-0300 TaxID=2974287 RepID=A0ABU5UC00_9CYAN|nr:hypothetical protein [Nodularia harveyana]MEA5581054.1 hypothetical protein [Nodularia harveyana UHCC-0300]
MKVAVKQQDLQLLALSLHEEVLRKFPSGETFEIKCAIKKDELMILVEHLEDVTFRTEDIFLLLKQVLESSLTDQEQRVRCFLKKFGEELPHAKCSLMIYQREKVRSSIPLSSSLTYTPPIIEDELEEPYDVWVDTPDSLTEQSELPVKSLLLGITLMGICVFGSGFYLLSRPCVMSECRELQVAEQLNWESQQMIRTVNSTSELVGIQQQLERATSDLDNIPMWSPRYEKAEELKASLSMESNQIQQVVKAIEAADVAEQKMPPSGKSFADLQDMQHLWRVAIAPLEAIPSSSEMYDLVQPRLSTYRQSLQTVNQELLGQEKWVKKINDAKAAAIVATERAATAQSLSEWEKAQSTWQIVINALNIIPPTSPVYPEVQELLSEYQPQLFKTRDRAIKEQTAARNYQEAINTANQAKTYAENKQWEIAVTFWDQALQNIQQISPDSFYYNASQRLIEPYSTALKEAQRELQTIRVMVEVRDDLDEICTREIRICTFTINQTAIAVSLTPNYEYLIYTTLFANDPETNNHWYLLQESLGVIGDRVNLPVFIYDTQGQGLYTHIPKGSN